MVPLVDGLEFYDAPAKVVQVGSCLLNQLINFGRLFFAYYGDAVI